MAIQFTKAVRRKKKARIALIGVTGGGKTLTALLLMRGLVGPEGRIAVIDTEHGSASLYSDRYDFDVVELQSFAPERYNEAIKAAAAASYDGLIIDSWSHAWAGKDGVLQFVDEQAKRNRGSSFNAWGDATPKQNEMVETILTAPMHVIVTMRAKMAYLQEKDERTGKTTIRKVGLQPVQRDGVEYEMDVIGDMNLDNELIITKSRFSELSGKVLAKPGVELGERLRALLEQGEAAPTPTPPPPAASVTAKPAPVVTEKPAPVVTERKPPAQANGDAVTDGQLRLIFARAKRAGVSEDALREYAGRECGVEHLNELPKGSVNALLAWLDEQAGAASATA